MNTNSKELALVNKDLLDIVDSFHVAILLEAHDTLLPDFLEMFGVDMALEIIDRFSGTTINIPKKSKILDSIKDADSYRRIKKGEPYKEVFEYHGYENFADFSKRMSQIAAVLGETVATRKKRQPGRPSKEGS